MNVKAFRAIQLILLGSAIASAAVLKQETLQVWNDYTGTVNTQMEERASGAMPFLAVDQSPENLRCVRQGKIVVTSTDPRKVPQGLIHHWLGALFIPGAQIDQVLQVLNDYGRYSEMYKPLIRKAYLIERNGDTVKLDVLAVQKAFSVTAAVETVEEIRISKPAPNRVCITANALRVQEIADYGRDSAHPFLEAQRPGFVWHALILERLEERDGGVYVELETVALSRGIPLEVRWLIKPLTDELPRRIMTDMLQDTRDAVQRSAISQ